MFSCGKVCGKCGQLLAWLPIFLPPFLNLCKPRFCRILVPICNHFQPCINNHNHRPCRWYALAPLGPYTSQAYRLIELSFACVSCPATADAVISTPLVAPSNEGAGFCGAKDWGREYFSACFSPSVFAYGESTSEPLLSALRTIPPLTGKSTLIISARRRYTSEQPGEARRLARRRGRHAAAAGLGIAKAFWNHQHTAGGIL